MELKSIQTKKIYKNIVEQIVKLIQEGSLKSGDKLPPERTLAEMLNVSRAPLREALSVMEIMGIVEIRPGDGSFVSNFNIKPFLSLIWPVLLKDADIEEDLLEFRKILELGAIGLLIRNNGAEEKPYAALRDIVMQMKESYKDSEKSAKLDFAFHKCIISLSDNVVLAVALDYVEYILEKTVRFNRNMILSKLECAELLCQQHFDIYEAITLGDLKLATERLENHLAYVRNAM